MATVRAGSPLRALPWRRPAKVRAFIQPIEAAIARLESAARKPSGPIYQALCAASPLFDGDGAISRSRRMRSDGRRNLISLVQALLASSDLTSGFLGAPVGQGWERHDWGRLDHRAFGPRVSCERSFRRTQRHARTLAAMGFVEVAELKLPAGPGSWRSVVAIKRLTAAFYAALGLSQAVSRARRERDRKKGQARAAELAKIEPARKRTHQKEEAPSGRAAASAYQPFPARGKPPDKPPEAAASTAASEAIAKLKALLDD